MLSIQTEFIGPRSGVIRMTGKMYLQYHHFLSEKDKPLMQSILKWHKGLISLLHLVRQDGINIPIDFEKLEKICWDEINAVS